MNKFWINPGLLIFEKINTSEILIDVSKFFIW